MYKVIFSSLAISRVDAYIYFYKSYFYNLYSDTGIFSEDLILEKYEEEAKTRHREIFRRIEDRLSPDIVQGRMLDNTLFLSWRSKIIWVAWEDDGDTRIIRDMQIR